VAFSFQKLLAEASSMNFPVMFLTEVFSPSSGGGSW
jgi:hypothetical protein